MYAPCEIVEKRRLWSRLSDLWVNSTIENWLFLGDFNDVRSADERRGVGNGPSSQRREIEDFNAFIEEAELIDMPLSRRKFTWVRPGGRSMSRID